MVKIDCMKFSKSRNIILLKIKIEPGYIICR